MTQKQLRIDQNSNASGTTLTETFRQFCDWLPRVVCNRIERRSAACSEARGDRPGKRQKSPLCRLAIATEENFWEIKLAHRPESFWYPYHTLRNVGVLEQLVASAGLDLLKLCQGPYGKIADIGGADGDLAFFFEKLGLSVDLIDNEPTNFNQLEGARLLRDALHSNVIIRKVDLDSII